MEASVKRNRHLLVFGEDACVAAALTCKEKMVRYYYRIMYQFPCSRLSISSTAASWKLSLGKSMPTLILYQTDRIQDWFLFPVP